MYKLSIEAMIEKINREEVFTATNTAGGFTLHIEKYVPFICAAVHDGSSMSDYLTGQCALDEQSRWNEEDPFTGKFIESLPIRIIGNDSRYYYDLNRAEDAAVYDVAWGKVVWREPLTPDMKLLSLSRHREFYAVLKALVAKIESKFGAAMLYDIHSYNYRRDVVEHKHPVFNLGTENINKNRYGRYVTRLLKELTKISFDNIENTVAENEVFFGRGYVSKFVTSNFENTVVFPLEVKKIYCDENTGDMFPEVIDRISEGMKNAIIATSLYFNNRECKQRINNKTKLLSSVDDPVLLAVDKKLYTLLRSFETLLYVNPRNLEQSKKLFFDSNYRKVPQFTYRPLNIDAYELKKRLYELPVADIYDISIQRLYKDIIREYAITIDMLAARGTDDFLYNSLRLYGKPDKTDVMNANYIIQSYGLDDEAPKTLGKEEVRARFSAALKAWDMGGKLTFGKNMAARVMVNSAKKTLIVNEKANFNENDIKLLTQHEIGVHMLTTINANKQPLKFLSLGTPNNVETQEGLAVLSEFLTGTMHINRLKDLAYRVIAVNMMVKGKSFREIFEYLVDEYNFGRDKAFDLTARVMRGGGFTKDYLYLRGFIKVYNQHNAGESFDHLLIGKTSVEYSGLLKELIGRGYLKRPHHVNDIFKNGEIDDATIKYILKSTKAVDEAEGPVLN
ncbi:uncharacterized protein (TIGR02421 family) [Streptohalobacillus salinus]|uniref:Uncharacterized protein (TIGR02421 family) n=1 Tax=Streptohalobacillus salinus TaxID=621096 RepID=A0A2V3W3L0_9BACI|nr:flavohemoglobin expression-modulating QEGLA motif protein [Streptohalobacillus salinus]PXW88286.1 uncharacterized protein (TIGR02421 family) [Streptohalobacillus salinus]